MRFTCFVPPSVAFLSRCVHADDTLTKKNRLKFRWNGPLFKYDNQESLEIDNVNFRMLLCHFALQLLRIL